MAISADVLRSYRSIDEKVVDKLLAQEIKNNNKKMLFPVAAHNAPLANNNESPGKNGINTTPVSIKIIKNIIPYIHHGPC